MKNNLNQVFQPRVELKALHIASKREITDCNQNGVVMFNNSIQLKEVNKTLQLQIQITPRIANSKQSQRGTKCWNKTQQLKIY